MVCEGTIERSNDEDLARIRQGVAVWNDWRAQNFDRGVDLRRADLQEADLQRADLSGADLSGANLERAKLSGADLSGADLSGAKLSAAHPYQSGRLVSGANLSLADLSRADLSGANLQAADLGAADLQNANLQKADLREANLYGADLFEANLRGANLPQAGLTRANLRGANLSGAILQAANLRGANLQEADLQEANLRDTNFQDADLSRANIEHATLVGTNLTAADLTSCHIYGISAWDIELEGTKQRDLVITRFGQPQITVDNIEVGQFIYLLLHNEKIRSVIDTIGRKGVLLLGRFTEGRLTVLEQLRAELRERDFVPMVFNFDKPETKDFTETVRLLAGLSRFVIIDITNPRSTPLELQATVPEYMIPFVPIIEDGEEPFAMFRDLWLKHRAWVLDPIAYGSVEELVQGLDDYIIKPALVRFDELLIKKTEEPQRRRIGT